MVCELRITGHGFKTTPDLFPDFLAKAEEGLGASSPTHIPIVSVIELGLGLQRWALPSQGPQPG